MNVCNEVVLTKSMHIHKPPIDLSHLKALNQLQEDVQSLPLNVCKATASVIAHKAHTTLNVQIILESALALVTFIIGSTLNAPALKEITWASEMSRRYDRRITESEGGSTNV